MSIQNASTFINSNNDSNSNSNKKKRNRNDDGGNNNNNGHLTKVKSNKQKTISLSDYVRMAFKENSGGITDDSKLDVIAERCSQRFMIQPTEEMLNSYYGVPHLVNSVRDNDLVKIRELYNEGMLTCNACNRFGESILHMACRRGHVEMIHFLLTTVGLSISTTIKDDYHRTPLHDAFWSASPNKYQIVDYLLKQDIYSVELLLLKDKRGFTPLDYARGEEYDNWYQLLKERKGLFRCAPPKPISIPKIVDIKATTATTTSTAATSMVSTAAAATTAAATTTTTTKAAAVAVAAAAAATKSATAATATIRTATPTKTVATATATGTLSTTVASSLYYLLHQLGYSLKEINQAILIVEKIREQQLKTRQLMFKDSIRSFFLKKYSQQARMVINRAVHNYNNNHKNMR